MHFVSIHNSVYVNRRASLTDQFISFAFYSCVHGHNKTHCLSANFAAPVNFNKQIKWVRRHRQTESVNHLIVDIFVDLRIQLANSHINRSTNFFFLNVSNQFFAFRFHNPHVCAMRMQYLVIDTLPMKKRKKKRSLFQ